MLANALTPQRKRTHRRRSARRSSVFGNALGSAAIQGIQNWQANRAARPASDPIVLSPEDIATPQTASGAVPAAPIELTDAEKQRRLEAAMPDALAAIQAASTSTALDSAELADVQAAASTLHRQDTLYVYGAIPDQPAAGAAAGMKDGQATITINLTSPSLFNTDGTVNMNTLTAFLVHEGRHIYDDRFYGERNGPSTIDQVRRSERNAYRTEAAYLKAVGGTIYTKDLTGTAVPLTSATANFAAENSVISWVSAAAKAAIRTNLAIDRGYADYRRRVADLDRLQGYRSTLAPKQPYVRVPVYIPPPSY